jgi:hypothetical protein
VQSRVATRHGACACVHVRARPIRASARRIRQPASRPVASLEIFGGREPYDLVRTTKRESGEHARVWCRVCAQHHGDRERAGVPVARAPGSRRGRRGGRMSWRASTAPPRRAMFCAPDWPPTRWLPVAHATPTDAVEKRSAEHRWIDALDGVEPVEKMAWASCFRNGPLLSGIRLQLLGLCVMGQSVFELG